MPTFVFTYRAPKGYVRTPETMGDALFYGTDTTLPDGSRQVVFATNRPISAMASGRRG